MHPQPDGFVCSPVGVTQAFETQASPDAQSPSVAHAVKQAVVPQAYAPHEALVPVPQAPWPSQTAAVVWTRLAQLPGAQTLVG